MEVPRPGQRAQGLETGPEPGAALVARREAREDILPAISGTDKLISLLKARLLPARLLCRREGFHADRVATVIFSSGSTGEPKGVVLTHHNIMSNIEALRMVFRVDLNDNI